MPYMIPQRREYQEESCIGKLDDWVKEGKGIKIYDLNGQIVYSSSSVEIPSQLPFGLYILEEITTEGNIYSKFLQK